VQGAPKVAKSCLYALSAMVRGDPSIQKAFREHHGLEKVHAWKLNAELEVKASHLMEDLQI
jgi:rubrerythrin